MFALNTKMAKVEIRVQLEYTEATNKRHRGAARLLWPTDVETTGLGFVQVVWRCWALVVSGRRCTIFDDGQRRRASWIWENRTAFRKAIGSLAIAIERRGILVHGMGSCLKLIGDLHRACIGNDTFCRCGAVGFQA